ncbi:MAG: hypothetical protein LVR00_02205 [Rhabdochlamydiaceae bacterium]|jgi:threonyl-tRNA synthetase
MFNKNLDSLRGGCVELMAAAVLELFPQAYLKGGTPTAWGFYYDFLVLQPSIKESLMLIEENMRQKSKKAVPFRIMEMVPRNAEEYFASLDREDLQERVSIIEDPLVRLVQVGDFVDICEFLLPTKTSDVTHFKLLEMIPISGGFRIVGTAFFEKSELKEFVKEWENIGERHYPRWIKELDLLDEIESGWIWLPRGEKLKEILIGFWKEELGKQNFQFITTPSLSLEEMFDTHLHLAKERKMRTAEIAYLPLPEGEGMEGLLDLPYGFIDQAYSPFKKEELLRELISSLQFIVKILKMFSFDYEVVLHSKNAALLREALEECQIEAKEEKKAVSAIEFHLIDVLGRRWKGPSLSVHFDREVIVQSLFFL